MKNLSILVVDDDPVIRHLLHKRLMKEFHLVETAEDGYVAKEKLTKSSYDVVLTDLMMPGDIGGIEVLEIAKTINSTVEVLLITAHSSVDTAVEAMKKGANDYLEKPINFDELFLRLDKIASMQTMLRSAQDLRHAMNTTESAASKTIHSLEIEVNRLRNTLDKVEQILRRSDPNPVNSIDKALEKISAHDQF